MTRGHSASLLTGTAAAAAVALVAVPFIALLATVEPGRVLADLTSGNFLEAAWVSAIVSLTAAAVAAILGLPLAWRLARGQGPGVSVLRAVVVLPLVMPPVVAGVGLLAAFGRRGVIGQWLTQIGIGLPFTTAGAVLAAAFVALPLFVLTAEAGIRGFDPELDETAQALGATRNYRLRHVALPLLGPQLAAAFLLAWARSLGEFGATITFAGNRPGVTQTMPLAIFEALQRDWHAAVVMSLAMTAATLAVLVVARRRFEPA